MQSYILVHLSDAALLRDLAALVGHDRLTTATLLAHIAEVDARRLYVPAGYSSMHAYCVDELRLSEDAASKRIQAARAARRLPVLFTAIAEGRLHLSGICLLAPHLTSENAAELIEAATHRRRSEIATILAQHFHVLAQAGAISTMSTLLQHAPGHVGINFECDEHAPGHAAVEASEPRAIDEHAPEHVECSPGTVPDPSERFIVHLTIDKSTHEKLRYAQALLSHTIPTGDLVKVLRQVLEAAIPQLEKRKLGAASRAKRLPSARNHSMSRSRYVPAQVRRAVWERDQGQCTFVGATGHRCGARRFLEFDHVDPVARGGVVTVEGMRLRCRVHNQYEAERVYGAEFMARKRREARLLRAEARARAAEQEQAMPFAARQQAAMAAAKEQTHDVIAGLRSLGCRSDEARRAAEWSETLQGVTLEERIRVALRSLHRRNIRGGVRGSVAT
jgi:5-methylcytosine-specific restriction endonuclease McrA